MSGTAAPQAPRLAPLAVDHRAVWRLAGPMILSNLSVAMLGLVDTAVVGHLSQPYYLGAVAVGAVIFDFLYWGMGFLRMGTTGITAQAHGGGDQDRLRATLAQAMLLALAIAVLMLALQHPIVDLALYLINGSAEVEAYARVYFDIRIWSAPAVLGILVLTGWFLGMQNARAPLAMMVFINLLNVVLDLVLVLGFGLDVRGVAIASLVSEYAGLGLGLLLVRRELRRYGGRWRRELILERAGLAHMLHLNHNIFIRTLCLILTFAFFTAQGARQGDVVLAANAVLLNFQALMALGLDGLAHACEALVGRAVGARDRTGFRRTLRLAAFWSLLVALGFSLFYALGGVLLIDALTGIDEVRRAARMYLPWMVLSPLISVWSFLLDGVFIGATRAVAMRNAMLAASLGVFLPAWYLLQPWGNHGLWAAFVLFLTARSVAMAAAYGIIERRDGWMRA